MALSEGQLIVYLTSRHYPAAWAVSLLPSVFRSRSHLGTFCKRRPLNTDTPTSPPFTATSLFPSFLLISVRFTNVVHLTQIPPPLLPSPPPLCSFLSFLSQYVLQTSSTQVNTNTATSPPITATSLFLSFILISVRFTNVVHSS